MQTSLDKYQGSALEKNLHKHQKGAPNQASSQGLLCLGCASEPHRRWGVHFSRKATACRIWGHLSNTKQKTSTHRQLARNRARIKLSQCLQLPVERTSARTACSACQKVRSGNVPSKSVRSNKQQEPGSEVERTQRPQLARKPVFTLSNNAQITFHSHVAPALLDPVTQLQDLLDFVQVSNQLQVSESTARSLSLTVANTIKPAVLRSPVI